MPASELPSGAGGRALVLWHLWESSLLPWLTPLRGSSPWRGLWVPSPTEPVDHQPAASPSAVVPTSGSSCLSSCLIAHQMRSSAGITNLTPSPRTSFSGPEPPAGKEGWRRVCVLGLRNFQTQMESWWYRGL